MKGTKYLFLAATALSLAACSSDDENMGANDGPVAAQITAGLNVPATRAENQTWGTDDAIGVHQPAIWRQSTATWNTPSTRVEIHRVARLHLQPASTSKMKTKR